MGDDRWAAIAPSGSVLSDGGTGTALLDAGAPADTALELLNVDRPDLVEGVHASFVAAGARLICTNTFGANRYRLERHGSLGRVPDLCIAGVARARAAGAPVVAGSMGPLGVRLQPYGRVSAAEAGSAYAEQAAALAEAGADLLLIETQTDLREMEVALQAAREAAPGLPVWVSATFSRDDRTLLGSSPAEVAERLVMLGADAIGVNCGEGPAQALRVVRAMLPVAGEVPILARPNAGGPARVGGRFVYPATPAYVATLAVSLRDAGVAGVGGCCGVGPSHVAAIAAALAGPASSAVEVVEPPAEVPEPRSAGAEHPSGLGRALEAGAFPVTVEMEPPRSFNAAPLVAAAITLREAGASAIDVADSPMAKMRMSAWAACRLIEERAGIETVLHFPTRGRNLVRLQGDLLGAHALGIANLFVCVGDPVTVGDYPQALNDVDVTATGMLRLVTANFNEGVDRAGAPIGEPTSFLAGAALAPSTGDQAREARLAHRKIRAGARFFLTQPLYDAAALTAFLRIYEREVGARFDVPILAGLLPPVSARNADFLHNEVPGIQIPEALRRSLAGASTADAAWRLSRTVAGDLAAGLRGAGAAGIYVMPQFGRYDRAAEVVEAVRSATS
jgi:homocysteine S-methyltransferase